jgi:C_GCAxxG_C_C family probable redox protein
MEDALLLATGRFARGFNCAQSVLSAFSAQLDVPDELMLRLAAPFGAGMGRAGETCGALSGALMVLGLQYARTCPESRDEIYAITRDFIARFRAAHRSTLCRELLGYDISTPDGLKAARAHNAFAGICPLLVEETARALSCYINEHPAKQTKS